MYPNTMNDDKTEAELFLDIGSELSAGETYLRPPSLGELTTKGRVWFQMHVDELRLSVCRDEVLASLNSDEAILVSSVADLISGVCVGVSPATVALLIAKRGLKSFCHTSS
jgi:hypothetical protein